MRTNAPLFPRPTRFLTNYGSTARPTVSRKGFYPNRTDNQTSEQFEQGVRPPKYAPSRGWWCGTLTGSPRSKSSCTLLLNACVYWTASTSSHFVLLAAPCHFVASIPAVCLISLFTSKGTVNLSSQYYTGRKKPPSSFRNGGGSRRTAYPRVVIPICSLTVTRYPFVV